MYFLIRAHPHCLLFGWLSRSVVRDRALMAEDRDIPSYSHDPDKAWSILSVKQTVNTVKPLAHDSPKPPEHTRFVCISGEPGAHTHA